MTLQCRGQLVTEGMHAQDDLFKQWANVKRRMPEERLGEQFNESPIDSLVDALAEPKAPGVVNPKSCRMKLACVCLTTASLAATVIFLWKLPEDRLSPHTSLQVHLIAQNSDGKVSSQVTRVEDAAVAAGAVGDVPNGTAASKKRKALNNWLQDQPMKLAVQNAIIKAIQQHPDERRWSGLVEGQLFSVVALESDPKGPARQAIRLAAQRRAHMMAVHDILLTKSLLDAFVRQGLDDAVTLKKAVTQAELRIAVTSNGQDAKATSRDGTGRMLESGSKTFDGQVAAYVLANQSDLITRLTQKPQLETVRTSYRRVMHGEARRLMELKQWKDALELWHHLHSRKLVSPQLYVDAATCFHQRNQDDDALTLLHESFAAYQSSGSLDFFEKVGDLAMEIGGPNGDGLAVSAYNRAQELL